MGRQHKELTSLAYHFVAYETKAGDQDLIWNSCPEGPVPTHINETMTGEVARAVGASEFPYPDYVPPVGDRIFVPFDPQMARVRAAFVLQQLEFRQYAGGWIYQKFGSHQEAFNHCLLKVNVDATHSLVTVTSVMSAQFALQMRGVSSRKICKPDIMEWKGEQAAVEQQPYVHRGMRFDPQEYVAFDRSNKPITVERWAELTADRSYAELAQTKITEKIYASTLWVGVDGRDDETRGSPLIFESLVAMRSPRDEGGWKTLEKRMYSFEADAFVGHAALVAEYKKRFDS